MQGCSGRPFLGSLRLRQLARRVRHLALRPCYVDASDVEPNALSNYADEYLWSSRVDASHVAPNVSTNHADEYQHSPNGHRTSFPSSYDNREVPEHYVLHPRLKNHVTVYIRLIGHAIISNGINEKRYLLTAHHDIDDVVNDG